VLFPDGTDTGDSAARRKIVTPSGVRVIERLSVGGLRRVECCNYCLGIEVEKLPGLGLSLVTRHYRLGYLSPSGRLPYRPLVSASLGVRGRRLLARPV